MVSQNLCMRQQDVMFIILATTLGYDVEVQSNKNQGFLKSLELYVFRGLKICNLIGLI